MASKMVTRCNCPEVAEGLVLDWVGGATHIDTGQSLSLSVHHRHCWSVITRSVIVVISQLIVGWSSLSELCLLSWQPIIFSASSHVHSSHMHSHMLHHMVSHLTGHMTHHMIHHMISQHNIGHVT